MIEVLRALEPFSLVFVLLVVLLIIRALRHSTKDLDLTLPGGSKLTSKGVLGSGSAEARVAAAKLDLDQYGEVATALDALAQARPDEAEDHARRWFSELATRLALRLKQEPNQHYRVAIWLDDPRHSDVFLGIGRGMFEAGDTDMDSLERKNTIGGLAFDSVTMSYYSRDCTTDANFKPRRNVPPSFKSVFGLALGDEHDRWGVMTVDARQVNGFSEDAHWLIRRFGELASLGAVIWYARVTPPGPPAGTSP